MAYTSIDDPSAYFKVQLYTGDGYSSKAITFDDTDTNMQPDFVWIKRRDDADSHMLYDSVRFDGSNAYWLQANVNSLEGSDRPLTAFGSDGFTIGSNNSALNGNTNTYVSWNWKKTADAGFDIVTATGNATAKTISHSLSAVPHWIISKERTGSVNDWVIYHHKNTGAPETDKIILNETNATSDDSCWNDTAPTSSVFSVGTGSVVNRNSSTYVYYLWSEKQGFSKFGSYTGNGNADGTFVYTGFRPAFVLFKRTNSTGNWQLLDNKRTGFNVENHTLYPNSNLADQDETDADIFSTGFKLRNTGTDGNGSGSTYIYMAFAESPFVNSNKVPTNAR